MLESHNNTTSLFSAWLSFVFWALLDHRALQYFSPEELDKSRAQSDDIGILRWVRESVKYYAKDKDCCAVACATPNPKIGWTQPFLLGFAPSYCQGVQTSYRLLSNIPKFKKLLNGVGLGDFSKFLWGLKFIPNLLGHPVVCTQNQSQTRVVNPVCL